MKIILKSLFILAFCNSIGFCTPENQYIQIAGQNVSDGLKSCKDKLDTLFNNLAVNDINVQSVKNYITGTSLTDDDINNSLSVLKDAELNKNINGFLGIFYEHIIWQYNRISDGFIYGQEQDRDDHKNYLKERINDIINSYDNKQYVRNLIKLAVNRALVCENIIKHYLAQHNNVETFQNFILRVIKENAYSDSIYSGQTQNEINDAEEKAFRNIERVHHAMTDIDYQYYDLFPCYRKAMISIYNLAYKLHPYGI